MVAGQVDGDRRGVGGVGVSEQMGRRGGAKKNEGWSQGTVVRAAGWCADEAGWDAANRSNEGGEYGRVTMRMKVRWG